MVRIYTYQDFARDLSGNPAKAVERAIAEHRKTSAYMKALDADQYDHQCNKTILAYVRWLYTDEGKMIGDPTAANNKICSNYFRRLNTQRTTYSLGNGVTFNEEGLKERLGENFDTRIKTAGYKALIHGLSFIFWNVDHIHVFPLTEFAPLWDEETGALRAGVRFWQVDSLKPVIAVLYEEDGFTKYHGTNTGTGFVEVEAKRPYRINVRQAPADDEPEIIGEENYGTLPIVPLYGSELKQSTLIGLQAYIDSYDLALSGFANNLEDCAEIYWIVSGAGGMTDDDLSRFRDRLKLRHIANVADADDMQVTPYTQEIPTEARKEFLLEIHNAMYESFGALDVHSVEAGSTNDHLEAAYQPLDENADDFEYQIIEAVQQLLALQGITDTPIFKRNRVSNVKEQTEVVMLAAQYLDTETIISKLPFLTPDEIEDVIKRKEEEDAERLLQTQTEENPGFENGGEGVNADE